MVIDGKESRKRVRSALRRNELPHSLHDPVRERLVLEQDIVELTISGERQHPGGTGRDDDTHPCVRARPIEQSLRTVQLETDDEHARPATLEKAQALFDFGRTERHDRLPAETEQETLDIPGPRIDDENRAFGHRYQQPGTRLNFDCPLGLLRMAIVYLRSIRD
jgi:hypothetical protein